MSNHTTSIPDFETLNIDNKTVAFSCLEIDVAELIGSIRWDAASLLNWRLRSSAWFAHQILMRMGGEFVELELRAIDLALALWPGISEGAGKQRISDLIGKLKDDQKSSGFWMVDIDTDRIKKRDDGSFYHLPTLYKPAEFPSLFYAVQMAAIECKLCEMPLSKRRKRQREIIDSWLTARGCKAVIRKQKEKGEREESEKKKPASLPCRCDCASCVHCASKSANMSEAAGARAEGARISKESVEADLHAYVDAIFECGQRWMNLGLTFQDFNRKAQADYDEILMRLRSAVVRANKPGLKLAGGQPK